MERKDIILAADDFGKSELANQRILELARLGKIDRVAVMADGAFSSEETAEISQSGAKLDIHLDLFNKKDTRARGVVLRIADFILSFLSSRGRKKSVEKEWERQIEKFKELFGRYPNGVNSHQHIHFFLPYFKIVIKLAKKYQISYLRFGRKIISENFNPVCFVLKFLKIFDDKKFLSANLETSNYLTSLDWLKNPKKFTDDLDGIELVCHPERKEEFDFLKGL